MQLEGGNLSSSGSGEKLDGKSRATTDIEKQPSYTLEVDPPINIEDPFEHIKYEDYVNDERSTFGNWIGYVDYHDRVLSRKFSMIDNPTANIVFGFFGWLFNRKQAVL